MANLFFIYSFMFSLLATFTVTSATQTDIACLKSIKDSMIDPNGYLNTTWNFNNNTEGFFCGFMGVECWHPDENRVLNLRLSGLGLMGQFPLGLQSCTSLTGLDLSRNELQGPIPSDISKRLPYITNLDLSYNNFSGEIPSNIANSTFLNALKLDNNKLTGHIPLEFGLLDRIKVFTVTNNRLSGPVPNFIHQNIPADSFANNTGLCGMPLDSCSSHQMKFHYSFKSGFVIGYVVFSTAVAIFFTSYCVPWVYMGERGKKITISEMMMLMVKRKHKITDDDQAGSSPTADFHVGEEGYKNELADLKDATDNFSENNVIGQGKMGMLYKASLPNGYVLAVKKLHDSQFLEEQFISELKILGSLRHINVLPLLGFCVESNQRCLVYNYMPNGNLYDWLHPMEEGQEKAMEWGVRVKVAVGLARGLAWLHQNCHTVKIIHLDISSKCILLDQNFQPKLSNFGEAMLVSSTCASSVNSEFWEMAFVKEDVHGFGVVLLEMITGVDPSNMTASSNNVLNEWIGHLSSSSDFHGAVDKSLIGKGFDDEIIQLLKVACTCVDPIPDRRPIMVQVYEDIKAIRERCDLVDDSSLLMQPEICPATSEKSDFEPKLSNFGEAIIVNPTTTSPLNGEFWDTAFAKEDVCLKLDATVLIPFQIEDQQCIKYKDIRAMRERRGQIDDSEILVQHHEIHPPSSKDKSLIAVHDPDHNSESSHTLEENLFERIDHLSSSSSGLYHAVDKSLLGQGFDGEILHFLKIASSCIHPVLDQRPTMLQAFQTATETDIACLKSFRASLIDPNNYLNTSWNFNNNTEGFICRFMGVECWHPDENRVLNLRLSGLGLKGQFPPGLKNCTSLTGLDLSHNELQGPIPADISKTIPFITNLDLSFNNFSGEIPINIANSSFLCVLKLDNNKLTGHIPLEIGLLDRIMVFTVTSNRLSGPVPTFIHNYILADSYANNTGLCGKPLDSCSSHQMKFYYSFKSGFVIGYIVFSTSVAIFFTSCCVPWVYIVERKKKITISEMMMLMVKRKHKITDDDQAGSSPTAGLLEEGIKEFLFFNSLFKF
ncbi:inactive leucine-rich repeat receptor-like protein kinase [Populus alba x Populus x berolinensis]|nr:inactive leucine-rich repeat receptor-like protein kinase [Populus alba x Populus x berolinensis]